MVAMILWKGFLTNIKVIMNNEFTKFHSKASFRHNPIKFVKHDKGDEFAYLIKRRGRFASPQHDVDEWFHRAGI